MGLRPGADVLRQGGLDRHAVDRNPKRLGLYSACMGSKVFEGVTFRAYPNDHAPRHVHGFYAEVEIIVDLKLDGTVSLAARTDAIRPGNASKSDVRRVLAVAAKHFLVLVALWERHHG